MRSRPRPERLLLPLALIALGCIAASAWRSWQGYEDANRQALLSRDLLLRANRLLRASLNAETAARGYLLNPGEEHLQRFQTGAAEALADAQALEAAAASRPEIEAGVRELAPAVREMLNALAESIRLRQQEGRIDPDEGHAAMERIRESCARLAEAENARWARENARRHEEGKRSLVVTMAGGALLFLVIVLALVLIHRSTSQRERLIAELYERGELLHTTLASVGDGVIACDRSGRVTFLNGVAQELTGWTQQDALGRPVSEVFRIVHEETRQPAESPVEKVLSEGRVVGLANHTALMRRDGSEVPVADSGAPIRGRDGTVLGVVMVFRDITEARRAEQEKAAAEERLRHAAKLESLGVLAGGIAHDFNNLLVGIMGNASIVQDQLPAGSPLRGCIDQVIASGERAAALIRQMLAYAGKGRFVVERTHLSDVIRSTLPLIQASIPRTVTLELELRDVATIEADASQLQQVVMNLVINAGEACGERPGTVRVAVREEELSAARMALLTTPDGAHPGRFVCLEVSDTGCGMNAETRARIFDPFFSTKFTGRGLGLAAVQGVVRQQGGAIEVSSSPEHGSTFRVFLPLRASGEAGANGTVLLVEGEDGVLRMARAALERLGYTVATCTDCDGALRQAREQGFEVKAVILDVPDRSPGPEKLIAELSKRQAVTPVVVTSGLGEDEVRRRFDGLPVVAIVPKPYALDALCRAVKAATA